MVNAAYLEYFTCAENLARYQWRMLLKLLLIFYWAILVCDNCDNCCQRPP